MTETTATFSYTNEITATFDVCDSTGSTKSETQTFSSTVTSLTITGLTADSDYWIRERQGDDFKTAWHHFRTSGDTAPTFQGATVNGTALVITFNESLAAAANLANSAFTVKKTPFEGTEQAVSLSGSPSISGAKVTLTLATAVTDTDTNVKVSYTQPTAGTDNRLKDGGGNEVATFTDEAVTNQTPDTTAPTFESATVNGAALSVTFDQTLDTTSAPAGSNFTVTATPPSGTARTINGTSAAVSIASATASLTLASAVADSETVTVAYTKPGTSPLRDTAATPNAVASFTGKSVANNSPDTTPPMVTTATVKGRFVAIRFNEPMGSSIPSEEALVIRVNGVVRGQSSAGWAADGGLFIRLASSVAYGDAVTMNYTAPADATALVDVSGNPLASFTGKVVTNQTPHPVTSVALTSNAGADQTYARGEAIEVTVTWSVDVTWDVSAAGSDMRVRLDVGGNTKTASLVTGGSTRGTARSLVFRYTVASADRDTDGVFPKPTGNGHIVTLVSGATLTTADGLGGSRNHAGLSADANHKVNGSLASAAPVPASAEVTQTSLIIRFNKALAPAASLSKDSFKVSVNGTDRLINTAEIHPLVETAVLMTLPSSSPVAGTDTVKVSYARPTSGSNNRLKDAAGNEVKSFTDFKVINLDDTTAPTFQGATVNETALVITFNESLAAAASLANSAFAVKKTPSGQAEEAVSLSGSPSISGATVTLTLAAAVRGTDTGVKVSYTPPTTGTDNKLADENGNDVASFTDRTVTNETDATPPTFESATVNRAALVITFNEPLAAAASLANSAFTVKKTPSGQLEEAVSLSGSPSISGATVTLTLAAAAAETDTNVKVSYARPASGTGNKLADPNANEVESFTDKAVTNETDTTPPTFESATVNGTDLVITFNEALSTADAPPGSFFALVNPDGAHHANGNPTVVSINGKTVTVTLAGEAVGGRTYTVAYAKPTQATFKKLQDTSSNEVASFSGGAVTNTTPDITAPQFVSATVNGTLLSVTFDEALDTSSAPPGSAFTLLEEDLTEHASGSGGSASIDGMTVTVTLTQAAAPAETYAVEYEQPAVAGQRLKDATGNEVATFSGSVTNQTPLPWPVATGVTVNGKTLTIAFDKDLDTAQAPAANRFRYTREGETDFHNPESVAMAARAVTLTLRHTVSFNEAITVRYLAPASGGLRGADGHVTRDFALDTVTNETPDTTPPQPVEAHTNPQGVVIRFNEDLVTNNLSKTDFTVKVDGAVRAQTAKPLPAGDQLLLRFSPAIADGETATVSYGGGTGLKDARLNLVQPFTDFPVESRVAAPPGPASIASVAITSTPSLDADGNGTPDTYRRWEKIEVTVTLGQGGELGRVGLGDGHTRTTRRGRGNAGGEPGEGRGDHRDGAVAEVPLPGAGGRRGHRRRVPDAERGGRPRPAGGRGDAGRRRRRVRPGGARGARGERQPQGGRHPDRHDRADAVEHGAGRRQADADLQRAPRRDVGADHRPLRGPRGRGGERHRQRLDRRRGADAEPGVGGDAGQDGQADLRRAERRPPPGPRRQPRAGHQQPIGEQSRPGAAVRERDGQRQGP